MAGVDHERLLRWLTGLSLGTSPVTASATVPFPKTITSNRVPDQMMVYFNRLLSHSFTMTRLSDTLPPLVPGAKLRPKERVLAYLEEQFRRGDFPPGARLPSGRVLAAELGVSVSTVQTVIKILTREGVISTEVGNGSFLLKAPKIKSDVIRLGVTFGSISGSGLADFWHLHISNAVVHHLAGLEREVSIIPIRLFEQNAKEARASLEGYRRRVDGIILRPIEGLIDELDAAFLEEVPMVHLNPPMPWATASFVSANFMEAWIRIGRALVAAGRRRIVHLTQFGEIFGVSNSLRHAGLTAAIEMERSSAVSYRLFNAGSHHEEDGYRAAEAIFAAQAEWPDAVVTAGDELAAGLLRYCREHGILVPEAVSLIGGSGTSALHGDRSGLTVACQPLEEIGRQLAEMICRMVDAKRAGSDPTQTGLYLPMSFAGGATTLPQENELLGIHP